MTLPFLEDTTLATLTWNSVMNPAGGIELYVNSHAPFVDKVLIYDTGSEDGTLEVLEYLQNEYSNLEVMTTTKKKGFSAWRNDLIKEVKTSKILMLDDDELLTLKQLNFLELYIKHYEKSHENLVGFNLEWQCHHPDKRDSYTSHNMFPKLFYKSANPKFIKKVGEGLILDNEAWETINESKLPSLPVTIEHFLPDAIGVATKSSQFYMENMCERYFNTPFIRPDYETAKLWKGYNPKRGLFK